MFDLFKNTTRILIFFFMCIYLFPSNFKSHYHYFFIRIILTLLPNEVLYVYSTNTIILHLRYIKRMKQFSNKSKN